MAQLTNNTPVNAPITPGNDDRNTFATHYAKYGSGGLEVVRGTAERNAIDSQRKDEKMVYNIETSKFEHWNGTTWVEVSIGNASIPQDVLDKIQKNTDDIARLKTIVGDNVNDVFTYRGKVAPTYPNVAKKAYYLSFYALSGRLVLDMPTGNIAQGSLVLIANEDNTDSIRVMNNGRIESNLPARNVALLIKTNSASNPNPTWDNVFAGFVPASLTTLMSSIKANLPAASTSSLAEIEAALKDKLHTFREIQTEFADQLHTLDDLNKDGFIKGVEISDGTNNIPQAKRVKFANSSVTTDSEGAVVTISGDGTGISFTDGFTSLDDIEKVTVEGMDVESIKPTEAKLKSRVDFMTLDNAGNPTQFTGKGNTVELISPLQAYPNSDADDTVRLEIKNGSFEKPHIPGFLAYIETTEAIVPKSTDPNKYHKGALFFMDVVKSKGSYISINKVHKAYGIQEFDGLDPNISGGNDYLLMFRASLIGKAPSDGTVRLALVKHQADTTITNIEYITDILGDPVVVERSYKQGQELGILEAVGIVNATGLQEFKCVVYDSFTGGDVRLGNRTEGGTGLLIQCLTSDYKTGDALQQFELDTAQNLEYSSYYIGANIVDLKAGLTHDMTGTVMNAGDIQTFENFHLKAIKALQAGQGNDHLNIKDNGAVTMFSFDKVIENEKSNILKGKDVKFSMTMTNDNSDVKAYICQYTGHADRANNVIITGENSDGSPIFATGWTIVDEFIIAQTELGTDKTTSKNVVLPTDPNINNFGFAIKNVFDAFPFQVEIANMNVSAVTPFLGYFLKLPDLVMEAHLKYDKEYKEFIQDNQGFAGLRYTINSSPRDGLAMPCGKPSKGLAPIEVDNTVNVIPGSSANGGEGGVKFLKDGDATFNTELRIWNEQDHDTTVTFWWEIYNKGLDNYKIPASEIVFNVKAGSKAVLYTMPEFSWGARTGTVFLLRASASEADGAFIESVTANKPMVKTSITFKEVSSLSDDPDTLRIEDLDTNDFSIADDNKVTIKEMQNIQNRLDEIDMEITITDTAKSNGWYVELDVDSNGRPSLSPKQRSNP